MDEAELIKFLSDNLEINLETDSHYEYDGRESKTLIVKLFLKGQEISRDERSI